MTFIEWWVLVRHLHVSLPLPPPLPLFAFCALPTAAYYLAGRPAIEGKHVHIYLWSQLRHLLAEPRTVIHLEPAWEPAQLRLHEVLFEHRQEAA